MNRQTLALIIQEGSRLVSETIRNKDILFRSHEPVADVATPADENPDIPIEEISQESPISSQSVPEGTACIPCSLSHVTACVGELNEAVRFARENITNPEVTKRVDHCLGEIVACERIDLAPESTASLPPQEKEIADSIAKELRNIRHGLEWYKDKEDLENLAAKTAQLQHDTHQKWLKVRLANMDEGTKAEVKKKVQELLEAENEPM